MVVEGVDPEECFLSKIKKEYYCQKYLFYYNGYQPVMSKLSERTIHEGYNIGTSWTIYAIYINETILYMKVYLSRFKANSMFHTYDTGHKSDLFIYFRS
jgi:hypothetical protein